MSPQGPCHHHKHGTREQFPGGPGQRGKMTIFDHPPPFDTKKIRKNIHKKMFIEKKHFSPFLFEISVSAFSTKKYENSQNKYVTGELGQGSVRTG